MDNLRMPKRVVGRKLEDPNPRPVLGESPVLAKVRELVLNGSEQEIEKWGSGWTLRLVKEFRMLLGEARDLGYQDNAHERDFPEILWQVEKFAKGLQKEFEQEQRSKLA